jgi:hypothetical protein
VFGLEGNFLLLFVVVVRVANVVAEEIVLLFFIVLVGFGAESEDFFRVKSGQEQNCEEVQSRSWG